MLGLPYAIITSGLSVMEQPPPGTPPITVQRETVHVANHKLVLETSAHTLLAKSSPMVNADIDDVGKGGEHS